MKAFLEEEGSDVVLSLLAREAPTGSSRIAYVECQAAFARTGREKRLTPRQLNTTRRRFEERWRDLVVIEVDEDLALRAGGLAHEHDLRASDAIHLASAVSLADGALGDTTFACWDRRLWSAAWSKGFRIAPYPLR